MPSQRPRWHFLILLLVGGLVGALALLVLGPSPDELGPAHGDEALIADARAALAPGTDLAAVSVVRVRDGEVTWAGFGDVDPESRFEIGSLTKTFNGLLLADAVARGEARLDQPVGELLPELADSPTGAVTLSELATHHGGLPLMAPYDGLLIMAEDLAGAPYTAYAEATADGLVAATRELQLNNRGSYAYSNLGASLLGHALARAAGMPDWPTLVRDRLFGPLGLAQASVAATGAPNPAVRQPHQPSGRPTAPLTSSGYAPAGIGVTLSASDLGAYAQALVADTAPGMDALAPVTDGPQGQAMGLSWVVSGPPEAQVVWHNGRTAGSTSMFAIDRATGEAVVILTNRWAEITGSGFALLGDADAMPPIPVVDGDTAPWVLAGLVLVPVFAVGAALGRSRVRIVGQALGAAGALLLWVVAAPWSWVPPWVFGALVGLWLAGVVVLVLRRGDLSWLPPKRVWLAVVAGLLGAGWLVAMLALLGWVATISPAP